MTRRRNNLKVACALDPEVFRQVVKSKPTMDRAKSDFDVVQALKRLYRVVELVPIGVDLSWVLETLKRIQPDVIFNLAHSSNDHEAEFTGFLDLAGFAHTGSGVSGIVLSNDKVRALKLLQAAGFRVPRFVALPVDKRNPVLDLRPPLIVKPANFSGFSTGIYKDSVVSSPEAVLARAQRIWTRFGCSAICEEFVIGREFRIGVIEEGPAEQFHLVGITECLFPKSSPGLGFKSYSIRANDRVRLALQVKSILPKLPKPILKDLVRTAITAPHVLDLKGYVALDVRTDDSGSTTIIEINSNPGLSRRSLIWARPSLEHNVHRIVRAALNR
jgi:D-alanine-D-alanine ligase